MNKILIILLLFFPSDVYASSSLPDEFKVPYCILLVGFIFSICFMQIAIMINAIYGRYNKGQKMIIDDKVLKDDDIKKIDSSLDRKSIILSSFETYKELQYSWSDFNYDAMRKITSDEMFNSLKMQLEPLEEKNQKNVLENIELLGAGVLDIKKTGKIESVDVILYVRQRDYVIDDKNYVVRGNTDTRQETYIITFDKISDKKKAIKNCPNCGAELKDYASQTCEFCSANIIKESLDFVITKIENVTNII